MKLLKTLFTALLVFALVGCASLAKPRDVRDNLAYGWGGYAAMNRTLAAFVRNGVLTKAQVRKIQPDLQEARSALSTADLLLDAGALDDAQSKIDTANKILRLLKKLIETEKAKNAQAMITQPGLKLVPV